MYNLAVGRSKQAGFLHRIRIYMRYDCMTKSHFQGVLVIYTRQADIYLYFLKVNCYQSRKYRVIGL